MRRYLIAAVACGVVISGCAIGSAVVLASIVARIVADPSTRHLDRWLEPLAILLVLWTIRALTHWLQARLGQRGASAVIADLSGQVLTAVTGRQPRQVAAQRDAAAVLVTRGLDGLRPYFTGYLPTLLLAVLLTPATVAVIAAYDAKSTAIVVITLPLIPIFMVLIGMATADRSAAALAAMGALQARLLDLIAGIPTLRALGRAVGPERRIAELAAAHRRSAMATLRVAFLSALVLELLATLGVAVVAVSIGLRLVFGQMSLATGLTVLLLAPDVYWPLRRIGVEFHAAQDGRAAAAQAFALIGEPASATAGTRTVAARRSLIRIENLSVASRDGRSPDHLTAVLEPGRVTVLTGRNGAGKSTILQVIAGLTVPSSGRVTVAGIDVGELEPASWWRQLSWLPQRPVLIPGTVRDNLVLFGDLDDIESACTAAGFDTVLATLPDGLDTVLGRGGVGLSLGQRQRLGLARALGSTAPVLLLDEPTAHLDAATEGRVLRAVVDRARQGATVVVVGHRAPVVAIGDRVVEVTAGSEVGYAPV
ncbi:thiol reductant ABC exporter subunit CydD [Mycobacterium persicum]|uniref:ATP-binding/permease protein CydD n=1 Tax=Mycobacterium persicum TaxID=1487726 RepID=A0A8E2LQM4_9MYCO|nr:thiol reductant ABC exporter subunit CydD [Mycobacterium persicum]KZS85170.1 thiol reductant ABC exporter subunit CydD [Mycobacterium persicum]ORB97687.1 thiol reductant ABC exporter subunit CydD [Mycobacterium persicum]ORC09754.1 thiol reductant ABC exporter subunit CydD [Mycobacterium persicum]VAZ75238.1 ATP-binding/permease protein CydD [Mycobacterium persicum]VAZ93204.1 ATP-binding/permease protein CydD [Mycobacterium persicum]